MPVKKIRREQLNYNLSDMREENTIWKDNSETIMNRSAM